MTLTDCKFKFVRTADLAYFINTRKIIMLLSHYIRYQTRKAGPHSKLYDCRSRVKSHFLVVQKNNDVFAKQEKLDPFMCLSTPHFILV